MLTSAGRNVAAVEQYFGCADGEAVRASEYVMLDYRVQTWLCRARRADPTDDDAAHP